MGARENSAAETLPGLAAAPGMALGRAYLLDQAPGVVPERRIQPEETEAEVERFRRAVRAGAEQVRALAEGSELEADLRMIFDAQLLLFEDPMLIDETEERIRNRRLNAEWALASEVENLKGFLLKNSNEVFRERASDLEDAGNRILANLLGVGDGDIRAEALRTLPPDRILVATEIPPSLMLHVRRNCAGIVTEGGGVAGHMAILARSRGIPTVVRAKDLLRRVHNGDELLVDGEGGRVIRNPGPAELQSYELYIGKRVAREERRRLRRDLRSPVQTRSGVELRFFCNADDRELLAGELNRSLASGVGLFRSEFLYMRRPHLFHQREEHIAEYAALLRTMPGQPVTIRLLDAGGDKPFPADGGYEGADRGLRGAALLLANERILAEQLRVILLAAARVAGDASRATHAAPPAVRILIPMLSRIEEARAMREVFERVAAQITREAPSLSDGEAPRAQLGAMLETPAAVLIAETLVQELDFFSVGSNDLTRLILGADRDAALPPGELYFQPAVFRMLAQLRERVPQQTSLTICGELGARPATLPALVGMGYREFSVASGSLYECLELAENMEAEACARAAQIACQASTAAELRAQLERIGEVPGEC